MTYQTSWTTQWSEKLGELRVAPIMPIVPTIETCGGNMRTWGCSSWSGQGSATPCAKKMRSAVTLNIMNEQDFYSLMARAYSKMTTSGFIGLKLLKDGSGGFSSFSHVDLNLWDELERTCTVVRLSHRECSSESQQKGFKVGKREQKCSTGIKQPRFHVFLRR